MKFPLVYGRLVMSSPRKWEQAFTLTDVENYTRKKLKYVFKGIAILSVSIRTG